MTILGRDKSRSSRRRVLLVMSLIIIALIAGAIVKQEVLVTILNPDATKERLVGTFYKIEEEEDNSTLDMSFEIKDITMDKFPLLSGSRINQVSGVLHIPMQEGCNIIDKGTTIDQIHLKWVCSDDPKNEMGISSEWEPAYEPIHITIDGNKIPIVVTGYKIHFNIKREIG